MIGKRGQYGNKLNCYLKGTKVIPFNFFVDLLKLLMQPQSGFLFCLPVYYKDIVTDKMNNQMKRYIGKGLEGS